MQIANQFSYFDFVVTSDQLFPNSAGRWQPGRRRAGWCWLRDLSNRRAQM